MTSQSTPEAIWEEPEHRLDHDQVYGSDKMYSNTKCFDIRSFPEEKTAFGLRLRGGALQQAGQILLGGQSAAYTKRATGIGRQPLRRLRAVLTTVRQETLLCQCSRPSSHAGLCYFRRKSVQRNIELQFRSIHIKTTVRILPCGCFIEPILGARIIACESDNCHVP